MGYRREGSERPGTQPAAWTPLPVAPAHEPHEPGSVNTPGAAGQGGQTWNLYFLFLLGAPSSGCWLEGVCFSFSYPLMPVWIAAQWP